eukprot:TRINITY_DN258043_c0_g1_i1.p1 TRINITY_DN258043_c0_g1~~TRINITY_DN258043_c0_g1_i1.p1  ORF type:complete len:108 (+),score=3.93 TRINITY_DN258043_c0_g1_i1:525-848(+)
MKRVCIDDKVTAICYDNYTVFSFQKNCKTPCCVQMTHCCEPNNRIELSRPCIITVTRMPERGRSIVTFTRSNVIIAKHVFKTPCMKYLFKPIGSPKTGTGFCLRQIR